MSHVLYLWDDAWLHYGSWRAVTSSMDPFLRVKCTVSEGTAGGGGEGKALAVTGCTKLWNTRLMIGNSKLAKYYDLYQFYLYTLIYHYNYFIGKNYNFLITNQ